MITSRQIPTPEGLPMATSVTPSESVKGVEIKNDTIADEDDRSSSLSDLGDGGANEELEDPHLGTLNDLDENDTEAETERLEVSPQTLRKHMGVVPSLNADADEIGSSPPPTHGPVDKSEIKHQLSSTHNSAEKHRPALGPDVINGYADQVSDISSLEDSPEELSKMTSPTIFSKKRKRPSPPASDEDDHRITSPIPTSEKRPSDSNLTPQSTIHTEEVKRASSVEDEDCNNLADTRMLSDIGDDEGIIPQLAPSKTQKSKKGRRKGKKVKEDEIGKSQLGKGTLEAPEDGMEGLNGTNREKNHGEAMDLDEGHEDAEAEIAAKNEEELVRKKAAMDLLSDIERQFATFRDRLYDERLAQVDEELASLTQPVCLHPEYLAMRKCLDGRRDEKIHHEQMLMKYGLEALQRRSIAEKAQHHGQYMQTVRDLRDGELWRVGEEWYQIQRERRSWEGNVSDYTYTFTTRRSQQITQQIAYNTEVSVISGIAKHVGFPAAPDIGGARPTEIDEDFQSMGIKEPVRSAQQNHSPPVRITLSAGASFARQQPAAEEHFMEQNPWANPQHPAHQIYQHPQRQAYGLSGPPSPITTPAVQRRMIDLTVSNGSVSTIAEQHSGQNSSVAPTPMTGGKRRGPPLPHRTPDAEATTSYKPTKFGALGTKGYASEPAVAKSSPEQVHEVLPGRSRPVTISNSPPYQPRKPSTTDQETFGKRVPSTIGSSPFRYPAVKAEDSMEATHHSPPSSHFRIPSRTSITNGVELGRFGAR